MKALEKVAVTPVQVNDGAIIDSFNTQDNKHKNAPSIKAVEDYAQRKVYSGTTTPSNGIGIDGDIYLQYS